MSNEKTPVEERRAIQLVSLDARDLVDDILSGTRDFSYRNLHFPESVGSYVNSETGSINQYVEQNIEDLRKRPIGFQSSILVNLYAPGIKLPYTNFTLADLTDAYLGDAYLQEAKFVGANVERTEFSDADLKSADFRGAQQLDLAYGLDKAKYDGVIILPKQVELVKRLGLDVGRLDVRDYKREEGASS